MRKGVLFSFIMVFLTIALISLILIQRSLVTHSREHIFVESRIKSMNNFHESLVRDVGKSLEIIARRAMAVAFNNVSESGQGLTQANETLKELIEDGTLYGKPESLMGNTTLSNWTDKIEAVSLLKGFDVNLDPKIRSIKPYDSFNLMIELEMTINISDRQGVASLNRFAQINQLISIKELEDPIYPLYTGGLGSNMIIKTPYEGEYTELLVEGTNGGQGYVYGNTTHDTTAFTDKILICHNATEVDETENLNDAIGIVAEVDETDAIPSDVPFVINSTAKSLIDFGVRVLVDGDNNKVWDIENLRKHVENSYYRPSENGPSYLDRLEGKLTCNYCDGTNIIGLESLVNKKEFYFLAIPVKDLKTNVDYIYFNNSINPSANKVKGLVDYYFWLDNLDSHQEIYNVSNIIVS